MTTMSASTEWQRLSNEPQIALKAFEQMSFIRAMETKALALTMTTPPRVMGSMHFCAGQEAVPVGAMAALQDDDQVIATYRGHGWAIACGLNERAVVGEICHRAIGLNGGRAGSAYMMDPQFRFIGENSIVGAGTTIACGVAMANHHLKNGRVVIVSIGDGAMNQGATHEALAFAAARNLAVIFIVENNGWSEFTPSCDMFKIDRIAQRATGYGIKSSTIDGADFFAVRDTVSIAAKRVRDGEGPVLIECRVPRLWGHYHRDIEHYRPKADKAAAEAADPLIQLAQRIIAAGTHTKAEVDAIRVAQEQAIDVMIEEILESPVPDVGAASDHVIFNGFASRTPTVLETKELTYIEAVNAALRAELENSPNTIVYGEDVGKSGGIFGAARYLQRDFGADRVFDTPIAENAILGSAVGAALSGMKPIVEIMWADFLFVAFDQLINQATNVRYITGGQSSVPMVVRTQQGVTPGSCAQHSQSIEAILAHIPGLKVALASSPEDAYSLLRSAAADPDPCILIEARGLYQQKGSVNLTSDAEPVGLAKVKRSGSDAVIITWGAMVGHALVAAAELAVDGIEVSVVDLRWLCPLDEKTLFEAVRAVHGKVLIVHEAVKTGGFGAEITARIYEALSSELTLKIHRLATPDTRMPAAPNLQAALIPNPGSIAREVRKLLA
jgi:2-oxoisovalerate dehydrogenase E1 component